MSDDLSTMETEDKSDKSTVLVFMLPTFLDRPLLQLEGGFHHPFPMRSVPQNCVPDFLGSYSYARPSPLSPLTLNHLNTNPNESGNKRCGDPNHGDPNGGDPNNGDPNGRDPDNGDPNGGDGFPNDNDQSVQPHPVKVDPNITLSSVGGLDEHIRYLKRAVLYPLKHKGSLAEWGIDPPKGIMFHGPPGTGKTLLAKALANELSQTLNKKFSFFHQKGGECFDKYFGESQRKLEELFFAANHYKPSIIFFDEIDGLCPDRANSLGGSNAYANVVTALLGLIDSVNRGDVFIIGATNRLDAVDPAIRRPGRFDKHLAFSLPNEEERKHILQIHSKVWPHDQPTGDLLSDIISRTNGYTGADLEKVCRDTIVASMSRSGDIPPEEVRITRQDWTTAVQNMQHSRSTVFGSTLLISQPISPILTPLVSNIVREILDKIKPLRPGKIESQLSNLSRNSLLLWDLNAASQQFTNQTIMRAVLSDPSLSKIPTYILDDESILSKMNQTTLMGTLTNILQQVLNSEKPCIIFIPQIHKLEAWMKKQEMASTFYRQLKRLRGENILLLATTISGLADQSDDIADLFIGQNRSYAMRMPNDNERRNFYRQFFGELIDYEDEDIPDKKPKVDFESEEETTYSEIFERQLETVVQLTKHDIVDYMLTLFGALNQKKLEWKSKLIDLETLAKESNSIIQKYSDHKLQQ